MIDFCQWRWKHFKNGVGTNSVVKHWKFFFTVPPLFRGAPHNRAL